MPSNGIANPPSTILHLMTTTLTEQVTEGAGKTHLEMSESVFNSALDVFRVSVFRVVFAFVFSGLAECLPRFMPMGVFGNVL